MNLTDQFVTLHEKLQSELNLANLCVSKAKTTHGISLFSVNSVDTHDLEPSVRIEVVDGKFEVVKEPEEEETMKKEENEESSKKKNSGESEDVEDEKKSPFAGQFRPFGVLEPSAAKDARKMYKNVIQVFNFFLNIFERFTIVDLVSTQQSIISKSRELTAADN
ncbi:Protein CBG12719 [Caenorhabditis briggsae]|uniref:Vacuolar ATPase assembly protein VMA22 n=1 Tax=Caenorhabditis briggsae TaxID=6238 RepID=A8XGE9_CAEBR|nr:Protein CBG12719 [Caenorhabditis briggsae]CAP31655.2 Protein CBG12719 [Caenorhabditis briggsae]